ncbi:MAG: sugar phosphate isomerase/epimerase [Planctomycetaceae bacterium]|nr:sugar phosphate isomerase/epimerase [Planctomycetaceae bacterium]
MTMKIGFDSETVGLRGLTAEALLDFAVERGFDGVQFLDAELIDPELDPEVLGAFRRQADEMGLYLEVGLPTPNPIRRSRVEGRSIGRGEHARDLASHVEAVAALGCGHARACIGDRHDRFRPDIRWDEQLDATFDVLRRLSPLLRETGVRVALETHADLTVNELCHLLERLGGDVAGVTLDTGNLVMRFDEPVAAAERLAPHVLATHINDAVLAFTPRGLCWQARPVGSGGLPMPDLLAPLIQANPGLNLSIALHARTYDLPIYDRTWLAFFPELRPESIAAIVRIAATCERRFAEGSLARPEDVEGIAWADRYLDWLASSLGFLRVVTRSLARF